MSWRPDFIESLKTHDFGWGNATCSACGTHARFSFRDVLYCADHIGGALSGFP